MSLRCWSIFGCDRLEDDARLPSFCGFHIFLPSSLPSFLFIFLPPSLPSFLFTFFLAVLVAFTLLSSPSLFYVPHPPYFPYLPHGRLFLHCQSPLHQPDLLYQYHHQLDRLLSNDADQLDIGRLTTTRAAGCRNTLAQCIFTGRSMVSRSQVTLTLKEGRWSLLISHRRTLYFPGVGLRTGMERGQDELGGGRTQVGVLTWEGCVRELTEMEAA